MAAFRQQDQDSWTCDPEQTAALLIGIEQYGEKIPPLRGIAEQTIGLAGYLHGRGVPAARIRLLLSGSYDPESLPPGIPPPGYPNLDGLRAVLEQVATDRGHLLWLHWSGHGFYQKMATRLLLATATLGNPYNVDLTELASLLRSRLGGGFPFQIWTVDACQTEARDLPRSDPLPRPPGDSSRGAGQMILVSSRPGATANFDPGTGRATFTEALCSVLRDLEPAEGSPLSWPPNLGDLEARVPVRLAELLGEARDRTQVYHHTPWGVFAEQLGGKAPGRQVSLLASAVPRDWQPAGFAAASRTGSSVWLDLRWVVNRSRATAVLADPADADAAADLNRAEQTLEAAERDFTAAQEAILSTAVTPLESRRWFTIEVTGRGDPAAASGYSSIVHDDPEWTKASQPAFVLRLDTSTATPATADFYHREVAAWLKRLSVDFPRASVILAIRATEAVDAVLMAVLLARRLDVRQSEDGQTWATFTRTSASIIAEQPMPGTDLSQVLAALGDAARRRDLPVPVLSPAATIATTGMVPAATTALAAVSDVARQLVADLESGQEIAGPPGRDPDEALLCSVRDLMPALFRALLRSYAADRTGPGWGVSLAVAAQADEDLRAWLGAAMDAQRRPDSADAPPPPRYGMSPGDAVLLELARTHQDAEAWKSLVTSPEAATAADLVRGDSLPDLAGLPRGVIACLGLAGALPTNVRPAHRDWWAEESWLALRAERGSRATLSEVLSRFNRPDAGTETWGARAVIGLASLATLPEPILRETAIELRRILHNLPEGDVIR